MQKPNDHLIRKMPLPIDIDFTEGTSLSDGWHTVTHKEASHIRIISVDSDNFVTYEVSPPRKTITKSLKDYVGEDELIHQETTIATANGKSVGEYRYFRRPNGDYYARITGKAREPHNIQLGNLTDRDSSISIVARSIAYKFDTSVATGGYKKFSRNDLKPLVPRPLMHGQKIKAILDILHHEGFLVKEIDQTSRNKTKELYSATDKLRKVIIPSPNPEQAKTE